MASIEKTFTMPGMSCSGCVDSVTRNLAKVPGITTLKVDVGSATVRIDDPHTTTADVRAAIERAGFVVTAEA